MKIFRASKISENCIKDRAAPNIRRWHHGENQKVQKEIKSQGFAAFLLWWRAIRRRSQRDQDRALRRLPNFRWESRGNLQNSLWKLSEKQIQVAAEQIGTGWKSDWTAVRSIRNQLREELQEDLSRDLERHRQRSAETGEISTELRWSRAENAQNFCDGIKVSVLLTSFVFPPLVWRSVVVPRSWFLRHAKRDRLAFAVDLFRIHLKQRAFVHFPNLVASEALNDSCVLLLNGPDGESRAYRHDERIEPRVLAVDHPVDFRFRRSRRSTVQLQPIALVR